MTATKLLQAYLATLDPPDVRAARLLAQRCLDGGVSVAAFITEVLDPAQEEVGRRWYANEWSVAQEHAATAITDAVLSFLSVRANTPTIPGLALSGCVEGEWHTIPVRMLTELLADWGHDVLFIGPSVPPAHLTSFIRDMGPVALLASCTQPHHLAGARRTIQAAHDAGVPVILGGGALDEAGVRAKNVGADASGQDAAAAAEVLAAWRVQRPPLAHPCEVEPEQFQLEVTASRLVEPCMAQLARRDPRVAVMNPVQLERTREDVGWILQYCSAALVSRDPSVLNEFTVWLRDLLAPRGVPPDMVRSGYKAIAEVVGSRFPATVALLAEASRLL